MTSGFGMKFAKPQRPARAGSNWTADGTPCDSGCAVTFSTIFITG